MYGHKYYQPPFNPSDESVEGLRVALERVAGRPISTEYARESTYNLIRFFEVLQRWDAESKAKAAASAAAGDEREALTEKSPDGVQKSPGDELP